MSKNRILIIGPDPERSRGGMATVIAGIINNQVLAEEFDIDMHSSYLDGCVLRRGLYSISKELQFPFIGFGYDVYHIHICSGTSTWRKMRYVKQLGKDSSKVVLHVHGARYHLFYDQCSNSQRQRIKDLFDCVAKVVVLSEEWRKWFIKNKICSPQKTEVLHNAVEIPQRNYTPYASQNVLFMGRLGERKSPDVLISAAARILPAHPDAHFVFCGDGDIETYRSLAAKLGISDKCDFLGWVSGIDKERAYLETSVYCLPSKNEGMTMSVLEAMSYGLATITTPVGGMRQVIEDDVNGLFFPVGDVTALAGHLDRLLSSTSERQRLGEAGRRKVTEKFGMETYGKRLAKIYEEVGS